MSKFSESLTNGYHHELQKLVGNWKGICQTWFEPSVLADESPMEGSIRSILGGRFVMHEYTGLIEGKAFEGIAIYGYNIAANRFESVWIDSFHMSTGIMWSQGAFSPGSFKVKGSYFVGDEHPDWFWRTDIKLINSNELVITAYNISPEGTEDKATETIYKRDS